MPMILERAELEALGFGLDAAIAAYREAIKAHALTVNVPAPTAHPIVERIVRRYSGEYRIAEMTVAPDGRNIWNEIDNLSAHVRRVERLFEDLSIAVNEIAFGRIATVEQALEHFQNDVGRELSAVKISLAGAGVPPPPNPPPDSTRPWKHLPLSG